MPRRTNVKTQLRHIRQSLRTIEKAIAKLAPVLEANDRTDRNGASPRRKMRITPERRAQMRLQGAYIGSLKQLGARDRARMRKVRAEKGVKRAIAEARKLASRTHAG